MSQSLFETLCSILGERRARDLAQELYGLGYAVTKRHSDPFDVDPKIVPSDVGYQWVATAELEKYESTGWKVVPTNRHEGVFAPIGTSGPATVREMTLVEHSAEAINASHVERIEGAARNIEKWVAETGAMFSGHVKVGTSEAASETRDVGQDASTETLTKLPLFLFDHIREFFVERDRLREEARATGTEINEAALTKQAIDNVAKSLQQESAA